MTDNKRRVVFFGSPPAAVTVLRGLISVGHDVVGVVTRPDRRRSRGGTLQPTAVSSYATEQRIPVVHDLDSARHWMDTDVIGIVVAYGVILPRDLVTEHLMINVHFSCLPRWRGAAPVERAILAGDRTTGVSIMKMSTGLDTGPVFATKMLEIPHAVSTAVLTDRLAELGSELLLEVIAGDLPEPVVQVGEPTYAKKISVEDRMIDWSNGAEFLERQVRAVDAYTSLNGVRLRVLEAVVEPVSEANDANSVEGSNSAHSVTGTLSPEGTVSTGHGTLRLLQVQPEGRRVMVAREWLAGLRLTHPARFDEVPLPR